MPELSSQLWFFIATILFFITGAWRWLPNWLTLSPPNIKLSELKYLFPPGEALIINNDSPKKMPSVDLSVQIHSQDATVIYHRTDRGHTLIETVDICAPPKGGIILTLVDGEVVEFQKIGGRFIHNPRVTPDEQRSVTDLLRRIRMILKF